MSDALALAPKSFSELNDMAKTLSTSALLPAALKQSPANVALIIQTGLELGMMPMQAVRMIHVIEGKPSLSADGMAGLCLRARDVCEFITLVSSTPLKATYKAKRKGGDEVELSFTIEQAKQAGLTGKGNWAKFPDAMLRARALSAIARAVFPDLVGGLYDPDELAPEAERIEKPVTSTVEPQSLREVVKRRVTIVDVDPKPSPPVTLGLEDEATVGWGKNAALKLTELDAEKVRWYRDDAEKKALENENDERDLWVSRYARYSEALKALESKAVAS